MWGNNVDNQLIRAADSECNETSTEDASDIRPTCCLEAGARMPHMLSLYICLLGFFDLALVDLSHINCLFLAILGIVNLCSGRNFFAMHVQWT